MPISNLLEYVQVFAPWLSGRRSSSLLGLVALGIVHEIILVTGRILIKIEISKAFEICVRGFVVLQEIFKGDCESGQLCNVWMREEIPTLLISIADRSSECKECHCS